MFGFIYTLLIFFNTVILALDRHPIPDSEVESYNIINSVLNWCFLIEILIKLSGLGFKRFAKDRFNIFDTLIVIMSIIEDIFDYTASD